MQDLQGKVVDRQALEEQARLVTPSGSNATGMLYQLTMAFPSWAGAILAVYSIVLYRLGGVRMRPR